MQKANEQRWGADADWRAYWESIGAPIHIMVTAVFAEGPNRAGFAGGSEV